MTARHKNCQLTTANSSIKHDVFSRSIWNLCWQQGNMKQTAPAQRMVDFTKKKLSYDLPETSYSSGIGFLTSPLLDALFHCRTPEQRFPTIRKYSRGFLTNEAIMIGVETRTSAPVRYQRDKDTLQHVTVSGLFPCGEGAGYAGGIVSAGIDGERCAEAIFTFKF